MVEANEGVDFFLFLFETSYRNKCSTQTLELSFKIDFEWLDCAADQSQFEIFVKLYNVFWNKKIASGTCIFFSREDKTTTMSDHKKNEGLANLLINDKLGNQKDISLIVVKIHRFLFLTKLFLFFFFKQFEQPFFPSKKKKKSEKKKMAKHKAAAQKPPKVPKAKKQRRVSFVKTSVRKTPVVDKTSIEREYFSKLRETHTKHTTERKTLLQMYAAPSILQCPRCKQFNVAFDTKIKRSQDEDQVKDCHCRACDYDFEIR